jgi:hypothetical protein
MFHYYTAILERRMHVEDNVKTRLIVRSRLGKTLVLMGLLLVCGLRPDLGQAHDATGGTATMSNNVVTSGVDFVTLLEVEFDFSNFDHDHHCVATASADLVRPGNDEAEDEENDRYVFILTLDDDNPSARRSSARTIAFDDDDEDDRNLQVVSNTFFFDSIRPDRHTIRWMARKATTEEANLIVDDASLTIVCTRRQL